MDFILQFVKLLFIIVGIHELGHFLAARMMGMRADVFALGMGQRLFGWNKITGFTFGALPDDWEGGGNTDYRLCLLPIGGYVKILGMVDESMEVEQMKSEPQPWEFRSKNAMQKAFVLSAGVIMNFILAIGIYTGNAFFNGKDFSDVLTIAHVAYDTPAHKAGFKSGDRIVSVNGQALSNWEDFTRTALLDNIGMDKTIEVKRERLTGATAVLQFSGNDLIGVISGRQPLGLYKQGMKLVITGTASYAPAEKAGMKAGDTIISVKGIPIFAAEQLQRIFKSEKNNTVAIQYSRKGKTIDTLVAANNEGRIGVEIMELYKGNTIHASYSIAQSFMIGLKETWGAVATLGDFAANIFRGNISAGESVGGPIEIAVMTKKAADEGWTSFLLFTALISVNLGIINLLPIPALDGGHLIVVAIEAIIRRELSIKTKTIIQQIGMGLLLLLMGYVIIRGIFKIL